MSERTSANNAPSIASDAKGKDQRRIAAGKRLGAISR